MYSTEVLWTECLIAELIFLGVLEIPSTNEGLQRCGIAAAGVLYKRENMDKILDYDLHRLLARKPVCGTITRLPDILSRFIGWSILESRQHGIYTSIHIRMSKDEAISVIEKGKEKFGDDYEALVYNPMLKFKSMI